MTLPAVLSILVESHENSSPASLTGTFPTKTLNFTIRVDRVVFQGRHFLLPVLMFDFLGSGVLFLFSLFGSSVETEYQVDGCILRDVVVWKNQHHSRPNTQNATTAWGTDNRG